MLFVNFNMVANMEYIMKTKNCSVCKERLLLSEFYKSSAWSDGLSNMCKTCNLKYDRNRSLNHPGPKTTGTKICSTCKTEKDVKEFTKRLRNKDGLRSCCRDCDRKSGKEWRIRNPKARYLAKIRQQYGIEHNEYIELLKSQKYKCKICGIKGKLVVDHCHVNLNVRGLLCQKCNAGLGMFEDNIDNLKCAIKYLKGSNG